MASVARGPVAEHSLGEAPFPWGITGYLYLLIPKSPAGRTVSFVVNEPNAGLPDNDCERLLAAYSLRSLTRPIPDLSLQKGRYCFCSNELQPQNETSL
jgi:hypothetical protein